MEIMNRFFYVFIFFIGFNTINAQVESKSLGLITEKAMVVSARNEASKIGAEIMKQGGNAFDAMIATELALAVSYPQAGNIGGGGFMVFRKANGEVGSLDYREKAPINATKDMYLDAAGNVIDGKSTSTAFSIGIPGTIAGMFAVHDRFGSLPMHKLLEPIIELAEKGVVVTEKDEKNLAAYRQDFIKRNGENSLFSKTYKKGDRIIYSALAETLKRIAINGRSEFYNGETGKKLVEYIKEKGGIISMNDLEKYEAKWREPIRFKYNELEIISMAPPSSGGITLGQIMKMIAPFSISEMGHNSVETIQIITEAERRAYADRNYFLGDPDFVEIPISKLLDDDYLRIRMSTFSYNKATLSSDIAPGSIKIKESTQTTHYSIVDSFGNAVSVTTTLNDNYGSKYYCDTLGFFLNNQMDDFSAKAGVPNLYGLIGGKANSIAPEKRMLSSMTPSIVEKNGNLFMVLGTPGGSTIITSVLQTILNVYDFKMGMQEAVNAPRFHHQWIPDVITFEPNGFSSSTLKKLKEKGYIISEKNNTIIGKVDAILKMTNGKLEAGADKRGDDAADGY
jgi:gamma-glutamyltranspeptidase/glutathione hydrolase